MIKIALILLLLVIIFSSISIFNNHNKSFSETVVVEILKEATEEILEEGAI